MYSKYINKMNPINVSNSECVFKQKLQTKLVKQIDGNSVNYYFKLCCQQVIEIVNPCTDQVALSIPKCFEIDGQYFSLTNAVQVEYEYYNMTSSDSADTFAVNVNGNAIIQIDVNDAEIVNKVCFSKLLIPVNPKCLKKGFQEGNCIGQIECTFEQITTEEPTPTPTPTPTQPIA